MGRNALQSSNVRSIHCLVACALQRCDDGLEDLVVATPRSLSSRDNGGELDNGLVCVHYNLKESIMKLDGSMLHEFDWNILDKFESDRESFCSGCTKEEQKWCKFRLDSECKHNEEVS